MSYDQVKRQLRLAEREAFERELTPGEEHLSEYELWQRRDAEKWRNVDRMLGPEVSHVPSMATDTTPMGRARAAKIEKMLSKRVTVDGQVMSRRDFLYKLARQGGRLEAGSVHVEQTGRIYPLNQSESAYFEALVPVRLRETGHRRTR